MITYREWTAQKEQSKTWDKNPYRFSGWFLFNIIPLYVRRIGY
jgi:hypothetical protein